MPLRLPQARDFDRLRALLRLVDGGLHDPRQLGIEMGAKAKHAARHAGYYREAAEVLDLLDVRRWALSARGRGLLATEPGSEQERHLLREAVRAATDLGDLRGAVLADEEPDVPALVAYAAEHVAGQSPRTVARRVEDLLTWRTRLGSAPAARPRRRPRAPVRTPDEQLSLLDRISSVDADEWPHPLRVPFNWRPSREVGTVVLKDLRDSDAVLLVMGYASLQELCHFVGGLPEAQPTSVRVVFGNEPFAGHARPARADADSLGPELRDYWLRRGISILHAHDVLQTIAASKSRRLQARAGRRRHSLHANMFVGRDAITVGSSNFTDPGLHHQLEANLRVTTSPGTRKHFDDARKLAEVYWKTAERYDDELQQLLQGLLQATPWRQALARGCAELLEGRWAERHLSDESGEGAALWPSQRQGIGQALYVLMEAGSVLIADASGSGKTRTGAWLLRALRALRVARGRAIADPVLICPPPTKRDWTEAMHSAEVRVEAHSDDALGHGRADADVESARILALDEAHRFVAPATRTTRLTPSLADHVVLFTAAPIHEDAGDLLGALELLGVDNLDDETRAVLDETSGPRGRALCEADRTQLRGAARRFTVRRTKPQLNALIDREPHRYHNRAGEPCRFPKIDHRYYQLDEPPEDRHIAEQITQLARTLRGVLMFDTQVNLTRQQARAGWSEQAYLQMRVSTARAQVCHEIRAALRSSRAALWEHLHGTGAARSRFGLAKVPEDERGAVIERLGALRRRGPPKMRDSLSAFAPNWLLDPEAHAEACAAERAVYQRISSLAAELSDGREREKAAHLTRLFERHARVVAFDARVITLAVLHRMLADTAITAFVASSDPAADEHRAQAHFRLGSARAGGLALCSDDMAAGVDLQRASAVVHLDLPNVTRVAQQRLERLDRMDSPHSSVESWWPEDAPEFALTSDERPAAVHAPDAAPPGPEHARAVPPQALVEQARRQAHERLELQGDAFAQVRALVEGERALVSRETYEVVCKGAAGALSTVAVVRASHPWGFFALPGSDAAAPRWIFVDAEARLVTSALDEVAAQLRRRLERAEDIPLEAEAVEVMRELFTLLQAEAPSLLPLRKQRALAQMKSVLQHEQSRPKAPPTLERAEAVRRLLGFLRDGDRIDLDELAEAWMAAIRPRWRAELARGRRSGRRRLEDLTKVLRAAPLQTEQLVAMADGLRLRAPIAERVVAAIIGVPITG